MLSPHMTPRSVFEDSNPPTYQTYSLDPFEYFGVLLTEACEVLQYVKSLEAASRAHFL